MRRILFVDDEPNVLDGLRRMLRSRRQEWDMVFAGGGEEALRELAQAPFDVIVSDMRMPGMDGATLLRTVQERHPAVVRLVLSGYTELEAAMRAIPVAHQFLSKPCEPDALKEVVDRACNLQELLGNEALRRALGEVRSLPTLPRVYAALSRMLADPEASLADLARTVEQDASVCAKVLQLVNSAFFGLPRRVTSIQQAVNLLGTKMLKNVALSVEVFHGFEGTPLTAEALEDQQRHALLVAGLARRILPNKHAAEDAFMAGMLHDIGKLVLATSLPEQLARVMAVVERERRPQHEVEHEVTGVSHAEIGAYLLGLWGLPYPVVEAVANHHAPKRVTATRRVDVLAAVHIADGLAHEHVAGPTPQVPLDPAYLESVGVTAELPKWRSLVAEQAAA
jgi:HD-like signal output (HDOD) protein